MAAQSQDNPLFLIGKDSRGRWVAQKQHGHTGGFFVNQAAALKFALFENGNRKDAVMTVPGVFELNMGGQGFGGQGFGGQAFGHQAFGHQAFGHQAMAA